MSCEGYQLDDQAHYLAPPPSFSPPPVPKRSTTVSTPTSSGVVVKVVCAEINFSTIVKLQPADTPTLLRIRLQKKFKDSLENYGIYSSLLGKIGMYIPETTCILSQHTLKHNDQLILRKKTDHEERLDNLYSNRTDIDDAGRRRSMVQWDLLNPKEMGIREKLNGSTALTNQYIPATSTASETLSFQDRKTKRKSLLISTGAKFFTLRPEKPNSADPSPASAPTPSSDHHSKTKTFHCDKKDREALAKLLSSFFKNRPSKEELNDKRVIIPTFHLPDDQPIPLRYEIIELVCDALKAKQAETKMGIFRLSGNILNVREIWRSFRAENRYMLLQTIPDSDPHELACALKLYLRESPAPLLSESFLEKYETLRMNRSDISKSELILILTECLQILQEENKKMLKKLMQLLCFINENSEENKMHVGNLGIVFGPNLFNNMRSVDLMNNQKFVTIAIDLIELSGELFRDEDGGKEMVRTMLEMLKRRDEGMEENGDEDVMQNFSDKLMKDTRFQKYILMDLEKDKLLKLMQGLAVNCKR